MKAHGILLAAVTAASPVAAQDAPRLATTLPPTELAALESLRKDIWVDWFTGDTTSLRKFLGPELIAIGADAKLWQTLDESLAASAQFKASGGKLLSVEFDNTTIHRFGDVVVMFSGYVLTTEHGGRQSRTNGRRATSTRRSWRSRSKARSAP